MKEGGTMSIDASKDGPDERLMKGRKVRMVMVEVMEGRWNLKR